MVTNVNIKTGIRFGYVSANELHPEVVDTLLYGYQADNLTLKNWTQENPEADPDDYYTDEELVEGTYQGVYYITSWLGGALNFFILQSDHITETANRASPCVPNAGILSKDSTGDVTCYTVPTDWWAEEY